MTKEISAGGILTRNVDGKTQILCLTTKNNLLSLPKGHVKPGESIEQAAIREVKEEVGLKTAVILRKLDVTEREKIKSDGSNSPRQITYFIMDGADYTFEHEENYVWVEFDLAAKTMDHAEEKEMLLRNKRIIALHSSSYFTMFPAMIDYDGYPWQTDVLSKDLSLLNQAVSYLDANSVIVVVGIPTEIELKEFLVASQEVLCIPTAGWNKQKLPVIYNHCVFTPRTLDNLIDQDLPDGISLFYARLSLNLSDTKTFFLINQVIKKMQRGAKLFIEGRGKGDNVVKTSKIISPNLILNGKRILRMWDMDYVAEKIIKKLGLSLISHKLKSQIWKGSKFESMQLILEKHDKQIF